MAGMPCILPAGEMSIPAKNAVAARDAVAAARICERALSEASGRADGGDFRNVAVAVSP